MLKEDQVIQLISRCEAILGKDLSQVIGNLRNAKSRAAAIWELIGIEEFSRHGEVEYEPEGPTRPDLVFCAEDQRTAIDFTYVYPRWSNERKRRQISQWVRDILTENSISLEHVRMSFDAAHSPDGYRQKLPELHEKSEVVRHAGLLQFIHLIREQPKLDFNVHLVPYDIHIFNEPSQEPWSFSSGGTVEEQNMEFSRTAIYRKIREKAERYRLELPFLLCMAGDERSAIASQLGDWSQERKIVETAFRKHPRASGALITGFEWQMVRNRPRLIAFSKIYVNQFARNPLSPEFVHLLEHIDFNRWQYTFTLPNWELNPMRDRENLGGSLAIREAGEGRCILTLPAQLVLDSLQNKANVFSEYGARTGDFPQTFFQKDWEVIDVSFRKSSIETGEDNMVEFTLRLRQPRVFSSVNRF